MGMFCFGKLSAIILEGRMDPSRSIDQGIQAVTSRISSPICLLKQGLDYFRQGRYVEGSSLCALAREGLSPEQMQFAATIDAFLESHGRYRQALQTLHQASRQLVDAENEQQALLLTFEKLVLASREASEAGKSFSPEDHTGGSVSDDYQGTQALNATQPLPANNNGYQSLQPLRTSLNVSGDHNTLPELYITCFGHFEVKRLDQPVMLCQNRTGQTILHYLIAQPGYRAPMDVLMGTLWPDDEPEVARHKVQVAVSALRRSLNSGYPCDPGGGYILCKNGVYQLSPATTINTDVDKFLLYYQAGRQSGGDEAITHYERACRFYTGPFLAEELYADWTFLRRAQLSQGFLTMCHALTEYYLDNGRCEDAVQWGSAILEEDPCDEGAHRKLMQAYVAGGRRSEALRQFQRCESILHNELNAMPMPETVSLFQSILLCQNTPPAEKENRAKIERK